MHEEVYSGILRFAYLVKRFHTRCRNLPNSRFKKCPRPIESRARTIGSRRAISPGISAVLSTSYGEASEAKSAVAVLYVCERHSSPFTVPTELGVICLGTWSMKRIVLFPLVVIPLVASFSLAAPQTPHSTQAASASTSQRSVWTYTDHHSSSSNRAAQFLFS